MMGGSRLGGGGGESGGSASDSGESGSARSSLSVPSVSLLAVILPYTHVTLGLAHTEYRQPPPRGAVYIRQARGAIAMARAARCLTPLR